MRWATIVVLGWMSACGGATPAREGNGEASGQPKAAAASTGVVDAVTCGAVDRHLAAVEAYVNAFESYDPTNPEQAAKLAKLGMAAGEAGMALGGAQGLSPVCQAKALALQQKFAAVGERAAAAANQKAAEIEAKLGPEMKKLEAMSACMQTCEGKPPEAMAACMEACAP